MKCTGNGMDFPLGESRVFDVLYFTRAAESFGTGKSSVFVFFCVASELST